MHPEMDFPTVLCAAQAGGEWAFDVLFRHYQPLLLRYLRAQEPRVAEDLAAEVWLALAPKVGAFSGDEAGFRGWLFTVARRQLIGYRRKAARRRTDPVPAERLTARPASDDPAGEVGALLATQEAVNRLVARLSPEQAEVVLLRVVAGLSVAEVAEVTERSPGSVRTLQHRALQRLATTIDREAVTK
jgi:RNA polymerase sigma-70 factor (ECF subfamily)